MAYYEYQDQGKNLSSPFVILKMLDQNKKMTQAHDDYLVWFPISKIMKPKKKKWNWIVLTQNE